MPLKFTVAIQRDGRLQMVSREADLEAIRSLDIDEVLKLVIKPLLVAALDKSAIEVPGLARRFNPRRLPS